MSSGADSSPYGLAKGKAGGSGDGPVDEAKLLRMSLSSTATGGLMDIGDLSNVWNRKDNVEEMDANIAKEVEAKYAMGRFMKFIDETLEDEYFEKTFYSSAIMHKIFCAFIAFALSSFIGLYVLTHQEVGLMLTYAVMVIVTIIVFVILGQKWIHPYHMTLVAALGVFEVVGLGVARFFTDFHLDKPYMITISDARYLSVVYTIAQYAIVMALRFPFREAFALSIVVDIIYFIFIALFPTTEPLDYFENLIYIIMTTGPMLVTCYKSELANRRQDIRRAGILKHTEEVVKEKMVTEKLLLNILPNKIARRLMDGEEVISDGYSQVTVLFADLVGWTDIARSLPPTEAVALLGEIVGNFDRLTQAYKIEKIKTIGDGYLVGCGLPDSIPAVHSARKMASFALDMLRAVEGLSVMKRRTIQVTIGIHTGPVVAGVIGKTKFLYDLWGDSVNTASRMQSHGETGRIHVTSEFQELLKSYFEFEQRPKMEVKGKGLMQTYYLLGKKSIAPSISSAEDLNKQGNHDGGHGNKDAAGSNGGNQETEDENNGDKKVSAAERKKRKAREAMKKRNDELDAVLSSKIKLVHGTVLTFTEAHVEKEYRETQMRKGNEVMVNVTLLYIIIMMTIGPGILRFSTAPHDISLYYLSMGVCACFQLVLIGVTKLKPDMGYLMNVYSVICVHMVLLCMMIYYRMETSVVVRFYFQITQIFSILTFMSSRIPYVVSNVIVMLTLGIFALFCIFFNMKQFDIHAILFYATITLFGQVTAGMVEKHNRCEFLMSHMADEERAKVIKQREESERLLHNILPEAVIEKMRGGDGRLIDSYDNASVLFADIVGFTILSSKLDARSIVTMLNNLFCKFDSFAEEKGLEKIKTIGDAYMVVCGLPYPRPDHAKVTVEMGLEMAAIVAAYPEIEGLRVNVRIGVHSGPVVGGIVGLSKMVFDIWGENVNVASKMESNGTPGCINISHVTRGLIGEDPDIEFEDRHKSYTYGGRTYDMFYARKRSAAPATNTAPNGTAPANDW